jgi:hypothetical protein
MGLSSVLAVEYIVADEEGFRNAEFCAGPASPERVFVGNGEFGFL